MLHVILILTTLILATGPSLSLDEAFEILGTRVITDSQFLDACETIDRACAPGDEACITRLMELWARPGPSHGALMLACRKADDETLPIILDAVRRVVVRKGVQAPGNIDYLGESAFILCERLKDPEPLLRFALETGHPIFDYPCSSGLKDKYLLEKIRLRKAHTQGAGGAWAQYFSDDTIPRLRALMREMYKGNPHSDGAWIAIRTLVELSDEAIIPDLEAIRGTIPHEWKYWRSLEDSVRLYLAKLKHQHTPEQLMRIIETERESIRILKWAVTRLLWLKTDRKTIRELLGQNRGVSARGYDIAATIIYQVFGEETEGLRQPEPGKGVRIPPGEFAKWDFDPLILDHDEYRQYQAARQSLAKKLKALTDQERTLTARGAANPETWTPQDQARVEEIRRARRALGEQSAIAKYSLQAVVDAAPSGD